MVVQLPSSFSCWRIKRSENYRVDAILIPFSVNCNFLKRIRVNGYDKKYDNSMEEEREAVTS